MVLLRLRSEKKSPFAVIPQREGRQHGHPEISTGNYSTSGPFLMEHLFLMESREAMKILSPPPGHREVLLALLLPNA